MESPSTTLWALPPSVNTLSAMSGLLPRIKINPLAPLDKVCVLSCGISTSLRATLNVAKPTKGSTVAVFGSGAWGIALWCRHVIRELQRLSVIRTLADSMKGWGVAVLVGVPLKDAVFKTHPIKVLNERTLKGTFFGNCKPRSDLPSVVEKYIMRLASYVVYLIFILSCADKSNVRLCSSDQTRT
ncbi:hypothetical protein NE237_008964 [Protea cynaroides]|uniref:alcohol dehydrogenase n=1 Tax=Protea cynaroides TaxID=273540 RepID=A0A9Q0KX12_9MAGN|nr:hypothetical protein NE237_008964 [Protea cynaroides]